MITRVPDTNIPMVHLQHDQPRSENFELGIGNVGYCTYPPRDDPSFVDPVEGYYFQPANVCATSIAALKITRPFRRRRIPHAHGEF